MALIAVAHFPAFHEALWGAAGTSTWLLLVYALPACFRVARGRDRLSINRDRAIGAAGVVVILLALGAVAPFIMGAHVGKEALGYGLGWQGIFGEYARKAGWRG